jgi:hypothetical protein
VAFTTTDGLATLPANYRFTSTDNGTHTFVNGVTFQTTGSQTLTATDMAHGSIVGSATVSVTSSRPPRSAGAGGSVPDWDLGGDIPGAGLGTAGRGRGDLNDWPC